MSLALRANDADFSKGLGRHAEPFVAAADLITGWDFKDFSKWKVGVVPGQVATALRNDGTASDEPFSRSLDGLGLAMTEEGRISYGVSIAPFTNVSGPGRTFMAMFNTPPAWAEGISTRWGHAFCTRLTGIRSTHKAAPNDEIGCGISVSNQGPISIGKPFLGAALVFMRANGNGTWTIDWPNYRMTRPLTFEEGGGADPVQVYPGGLSGPLYSGNVSVRPDRYPFQRQGSRSSTLVIM